MEVLKTLIIGSGPAGYTAAIYAARADLKPVLYTGMEPGGQLTTTTEVDNFPGYPDGVDGPTMMVQLQQQAERFGTEVRVEMIEKIELATTIGGIHKAFTAGGTEIQAQTIIISTGATAKYLGLTSEQRLRGGRRGQRDLERSQRRRAHRSVPARCAAPGDRRRRIPGLGQGQGRTDHRQLQRQGCVRRAG